MLFRSPATPEEAAARAIRQLERAAAGTSATLEIEGVAGRFTDWAARLAERKSTAGAYAYRAIGEVRRAARFEGEEKRAEALESLARAVADFGSALTIDPELAPALGDRALVEVARARLLDGLGRGAEAESALERARADLARALELMPESGTLRANQALLPARSGAVEPLR